MTLRCFSAGHTSFEIESIAFFFLLNLVVLNTNLSFDYLHRLCCSVILQMHQASCKLPAV